MLEGKTDVNQHLFKNSICVLCLFDSFAHQEASIINVNVDLYSVASHNQLFQKKELNCEINSASH